MTPSASILWPAIAITLGVIGLIILAFALFRDRSRGRRRCPKCWYSMDGAPTLTCPECGRVAKTEKKLFKTRRGRRGIAVALTFFIAAYGAWKWPEVQRNGWTSLIPTTVLVWIAPTPDYDFSQAAGLARRVVQHPLTSAIQDRLHQGVAPWQSQIFMQRWLDNDGINPRTWITAPPVWHTERNLPLRIEHSNLSVYGHASVDHAWESGADRLWIAPEAMLAANGEYVVCLRLQLRSRSLDVMHYVYSCTVPLSTVFVDDPSEVLAPVEAPECDLLVAKAVQPRIVRRGDHFKVAVDTRPRGQAWTPIAFAVGYDIAIVTDDGRVLAKGPGSAMSFGGMELDPEAVAVLQNDHTRARFVIEGRKDEALEDYLEWPFPTLSGRWWKGRVEVPLRVENSAAEDE
jgi:hypothetical protein